MRSELRDLEHALLQYFVHDEWAARGLQPLSSIMNQIQPGGRASAFFGHIRHPIMQRDVDSILERLTDEGMLERKAEEGEPSHYRASDQAIYEDSFEEPAYVIDIAEVGPTSIDSSRWTGLAKEGVLSEDSIVKLQAALSLVDQAVCASGATNQEKAQARAYLIALQALSDAPEPPADLIWKIVMVIAAISGIGSFFTDLLALYN